MKKIIILLIVVAIAYAYHHKPLLDAHKKGIYLKANPSASIDETVYALPEWDGLELSDLLLVTATRDKAVKSMVSVGMFDHVLVVNADWAPKAFKLERKNQP